MVIIKNAGHLKKIEKRNAIRNKNKIFCEICEKWILENNYLEHDNTQHAPLC